MHPELLQDLFRVETLSHEESILTLLYLHFQKIAESARRNLTMQLINNHIYTYLTFFNPRDQFGIHIDGDN